MSKPSETAANRKAGRKIQRKALKSFISRKENEALEPAFRGFE
jgi:hypothetical protein